MEYCYLITLLMWAESTNQNKLHAVEALNPSGCEMGENSDST